MRALALALLVAMPALAGAQGAVPDAGAAPWVLVGTLTGQHPKAFIRWRAGHEKAVAVGEEIAPGLVLAAVGTRFATVRRDGRLERVGINWKSAGLVAPRRPAPALDDAVAPAALAPMATQGVAPRNTALRRVVRTLLESPGVLERVLAAVELQPAEEGGVRLGTQSTDGVLDQFGLGKGDVVRAVNAAPVRSAVDLEQMLRAAGNVDGMTLGILRDGTSHTVAYHPQRGLEVSRDPP